MQAFAETGLYSPLEMKQLLLEKTLPVVQSLVAKKTSLSRKPYVTMQTFHNLPIDTTDARVIFWTPSMPRDSLTLDYLGNERYGGHIRGDFNLGDSLYYQFAVNELGDANVRGVSPVHHMVLSYEDFESGLEDWHVQQGGWGLDDLRARSGVYSLSESPAGDHPDNAELTATLKNGLDLSDLKDATLVFWTLYGFQPGDFGYVEVSNDDGQTWQQLELPLSGAAGTFVEARYGLNDFTGPGNENVLLRFRFSSNESISGPGWFIDDISIVPLFDDVRFTADALPVEFELYKNFPNPFNANTVLRYAVPQQSHVTLSIYNTIGQNIVTLVDEEKPAGVHSITWNGLDSDGQLAPSGVYFYRLQADDFAAVRKLMMVK